MEQIILQFETEFHEGRSRPLSHYLPDDDAALRGVLLVELVKVDMELRWKAGCAWTLERYVEAYPELGRFEQLPAELVYEAFRLARSYGVADNVKVFCQNYSCQTSRVLQLVQHQNVESVPVIRRGPPTTVRSGQVLGDFELLRLLGSGAFAHVFLARQISLDREVALKVSANHGVEAHLMANLEHDNIVQVFSETTESDLRLLCMQYVPGTTLGRLLRSVEARNGRGVTPPPLTGAAIVGAIDELTTGSVAIQAAGLAERELLSAADAVEAVCWIGAKLADALQFAHQRGVLHCDIKPDNILLNPFGRPLLADFNLSLDRARIADRDTELFGGSLPYMSPEHLAAFNAADPTGPDAVDHRADIYSLGVVLLECITGLRPFADPASQAEPSETITVMRKHRSEAMSLRSRFPHVPQAMDEVVTRCLRREPNERFQSAAELRQALFAVRELRSMERAQPLQGAWWQMAARHPLLALLGAALVPNLIGSTVNIAYNMWCIVPRLMPEQVQVFRKLLIGYNLVTYPTCILLLYGYAQRFLAIGQLPGGEQLGLRDRARQNLLKFPVILVAIGCLGWLPGGFLFPACIHLSEGPLGIAVFGHFAIDFTVSGLIALTYSYFGAQAILLQSLYLPLLVGVEQPGATAGSELQGVPSRIRLAQIGAGVIPLSGALLLVFAGPGEPDGGGSFRVLVFMLIVLGMLGFSLSISFGNKLQRMLNAMCG